MPTQLIGLLGHFKLELDSGGPIPLSQRQQALLAYLVLHAGTPLLRAQVAAHLWPDSSHERSLASLRKLLHDLCQAVPALERFIVAERTGIQWVGAGHLRSDVEQFQSALQSGDLERAVELYRGDLLTGHYDEWVIPYREELRHRYQGALSGLAARLEAARDYTRAIRSVMRLRHLEPLAEEHTRTLMRLHALSGDLAAAQHAYQVCVDHLRREVGADPSAETRSAYQLLIRNSLPAERSPPGMVGRLREWSAVIAAWKEAAVGAPRLLLLTGEAGMGKTMLATQLYQWALRQGISSAYAACYGAEGNLALAPVVSWLRLLQPPDQKPPELEPVWLQELCRLMPELAARHPGLPRPQPLTQPWQRLHLFEAMARAILIRQPLLLVLDDIHHGDRETLEWLRYLMRYDQSARILVVGTVREGKAAESGALAALRSALSQEQRWTEIRLEPLDDQAIAALAERERGQTLDPADIALLHQASGGNPLVAVETLRTWRGVGAAGFAPVFSTLVRTRLARISIEAAGVAEAAALIGGAFSIELLGRVVALPREQLLTALDELWRERLIGEQPGGGYGFTHDRIREAVLDSISPIQRLRLHREIADGLTDLAGGEVDRLSQQIAWHLEQANYPRLAAERYWQAGEWANRLYANERAIECYRNLIRLGDQTRIAEALHRIGEVLSRSGRLAEAETELRRSLAVSGVEQPARARIMITLAFCLRRQNQYEEALSWLDRARRILAEANEPMGLLQTLNHRALIYQYQGDWERALACCGEIRAVADSLPDLRVQALAVASEAYLHHETGRYREALERFRQMREIAEALDDKWLLCAALGHCAIALWLSGGFREATQIWVERVTLAEQIGDRMGLGVSHIMAGGVLADAGEQERADSFFAWGAAVLRNGGDHRALTVCSIYWGELLVQRGEHDRAARLLQAGLAVARTLGLRAWVARALEAEAQLWLARSRHQKALSAAQAAEAMARELGHDTFRARAGVLACRIRAELGDPGRAEALEELRALPLAGPIRALIAYERWRCRPEDEGLRTEAAQLVCHWASQAHRPGFVRIYREMTGSELEPGPLPDLGGRMPGPGGITPEDLAAFLEQRAAIE